MERHPILQVKNLNIKFSQFDRGLRRKTLEVISDLDIDLHEGEILAVVGASGSGKSLLAHAILDLLPENAEATGTFIYQRKALSVSEKRALRGKAWVLVPQSVNYLDPLLKVRRQIEITMPPETVKRGLVGKWLGKYGLSKAVEAMYPFQLSGGMARKVLLTTALAMEAKVIIADEPTPGLDEASLKAVLKDLRALADTGCAVLMITHDIDAALQVADQIAIFYAGTTVEVARASDFEVEGEMLRHPYTKALYDALPTRHFRAIKGTQPSHHVRGQGCLFAERCDRAIDKCRTHMPVYKNIRNGKVKCHEAT